MQKCNINTNINYFQEKIYSKKNYYKVLLTPFEDIYQYFIDENKAIDYLFQINILYKLEKCDHCNNKMAYYKNLKYFKCLNYKCRRCISIFKNTIFYKSNLPICKILHILYEFLKKSPQNTVAVSLKVTPVTISYYYNLFRKLIVDDTLNNIKNDILGGKGKEVEVDESLFNKRKYNKGKYKANGVWVLGG